MSLDAQWSSVLSIRVKRKDGHVTGQETPRRQGPYGFGYVDVLPEIATLSE